MKAKFDLKYRQQIESGEYKVETVNGRQVRIVCWDAHNPYRENDIVALATSSSGEGENILRYYSNGHLISDSANVGNKDLMVIIPDDDERIKKIITDSIFYQYGAGAEYKDVLDYLDRLEKQKEPEKDAETRWENGTLVVDCSKQKPAEWSEKDKHNLNSVINLVHATTDGAWGSVIGVQIENWLKNLPERFNLQPKQEWSERRKKELGDYLLNMIKLVNTGAEKPRYTNDELEKYVEKCVQDVIDLCPISQQPKQEWSEDKYPKNIETDAVMFCFDKGFNITPYQAKTIAKHYYELGFKRMGDGKA